MEYVYSALVLHSADQEISEESVQNVLQAAGVEPDEARVKALVSSLSEIDIEEALETPAAGAPAPQPAAAGDGGEEEAEADDEEAEEEDEVSEEEAAEGLGALFD